MPYVDDIRPEPERGQATIYTAPELERGGPGSEPSPRPSRVMSGVLVGGSTFETVCGAFAVLLSIIALAGAGSITLGAISAILVGCGLVAFSGGIAARWKEVQSRLAGRDQKVGFGALGTEGLGGVAGIVLGVLALLGVAPVTLLCVAAIALGCGLLLGGPGEVELERLAPADRPRPRMTQALRASAGVMGVAGAVSAVLGILALIGVGPSLTMALVAMLVLGCGLVLGGAAAAFRFGMPLRHRVA